MNINNILLIEDEAPKRKHIKGFLEKTIQDACIIEANSVSAAIDMLDDNEPDLVILDMSLPTFDIKDGDKGGRPQGFGGVEVLRYIDMSEIHAPTIVVTGYEAFPRDGETLDLNQLRHELKRDYPNIVLSVLHFNSVYDQWVLDLEEALKNILAEDS